MTTQLDVFAIAGLFVGHVRAACAGRVGIVAYYGSHATGSASPSSDLDLYYIPDDAGDDLYRSFVVGGVAFEFWPVSWEFAGRIASGRHHWSEAPSIIANARVLYARSEADAARFAGLQAQIAELQRPASRPAMVGVAEEGLRAAAWALAALGEARAQGDLTGARAAGADVAAGALDCLAALSQTFFARGWASDLRQLRGLTVRPDGLEEHVRAILTAADAGAIHAAAAAIVRGARATLEREQAALAPPRPAGEVFRGFYAGIVEYLNKVRSACARGDMAAAGAAALRLQRDVAAMLARVEGGAPPGDAWGTARGAFARAGFPDMMPPVAAGDLPALAEAARRFDLHARGYFAREGIPLNTFEALEDLGEYMRAGG